MGVGRYNVSKIWCTATEPSFDEDIQRRVYYPDTPYAALENAGYLS